jgi:hypothetical protein
MWRAKHQFLLFLRSFSLPIILHLDTTTHGDCFGQQCSNSLTLARRLIRVHVVESFSVEILIESVGCRRIGIYDEFRCNQTWLADTILS